MKVTYDFDLPEEATELKLHQIAGDMYSALWDLQEYRRRLYKGYDPLELDQVLDKLDEILIDSKIGELT